MNERYDYMAALKADIREYIGENHGAALDDDTVGDIDYDALFDELWIADSVTGNASGSYTFNTWRAEEYICHNTELIREIADDWGWEVKALLEPETVDVTIRCYLLPRALSDVLDELQVESGK